MLIDWFTVGAQIVNFLVLLALLKWLLFDRIVRAMDQREEKIASRLHHAAHREEEARRRAAALEEDRRELQSQRQEMLQNARDEADSKRRELVEQARAEVEQMHHQWRRDVERQQARFLGEMTERAGEALHGAVRKALTEMADADVQQALVRTFLSRLEAIDGEKRQRFGEAIEEAGGRVVVASANGLRGSQRSQIEEALKRHFRDDLHVDFETSPELISGLDVRSHGRALGWSLRQYLDEFHQALDEALREGLETTGTASE